MLNSPRSMYDMYRYIDIMNFQLYTISLKLNMLRFAILMELIKDLVHESVGTLTFT